jgi:flagellar motor switch protein FliN
MSEAQSLADGAMSEEDRMAAEWAAALSESKPSGEVASEVAAPVESVAPAAFANFSQGLQNPLNGKSDSANTDINMILDIPVQLTVELGRKRIAIKNQWTCWSTATSLHRVRWWWSMTSLAFA